MRNRAVNTLQPVNWAISDQPVAYPEALAAMERRVTAINAGEATECVWLLEHPPLYTSGTSANPADLIDPNRFPVFDAGRGGQFTYHGPGQRVAYVMLDLKQRTRDVRLFVYQLEQWVIDTLSVFNVDGGRREGRVGVWVDRTVSGGVPREDKIAALGVRLKKWVSFHGISLNVDPDLTHFEGITPCGINDPRYGVTSLVELGHPVTLEEVDHALRRSFEPIFGKTARALPPL